MADPLSWRRNPSRPRSNDLQEPATVQQTPLEGNGAEPANIPLRVRKGDYTPQTPLAGNGAEPSNIPLSEVGDVWHEGSPPGGPLASPSGGSTRGPDGGQGHGKLYGGSAGAESESGVDPLDGAKAKATHTKLLQWFYFERDRQALNRMEMAVDHDFYDGDQWDQESIDTLEDRRQLPVVYNEVAPMVDWMIGTERRNRVDWRVLPRQADDVEMAEVKSEVLKYVSDINRTAFQRSQAFADAVKGGIGWIDDGYRDDPTRDPLYSTWEDWRNVLHDSTVRDYTGEQARYVFRWRWVDEDVAMAMFPRRAARIREAVEDWSNNDDALIDELDWQTPNSDATFSRRSGALSPLAGATVAVDAQRRRVRLIECQYREPTIVKFIASGPLKGVMLDQRDRALVEALKASGGTLVDRITMRVHVAVFTEAAMLSMGPSMYRHNRFSLTPVICYMRGRDRQPYGMVRRVRTIQQDINKRASKANWLVNTNQLIGDEDAFSDWEQAREEAQDPSGVLPHKKGAKVEIRRDAEAAKGQLDMMQIGVQAIQRNSVTNENLGRQTNATSEVAIRARQLQGSVTTTEPFDNLRLAVQVSGEKQLSNIEQFYSEEKALRLTGARGPIKWLQINVPEVQPDGSVRWINDVTASAADFQVADADYAGTLRQVMFDSLIQLSQRLQPDAALRLLRMAFEYSDLPNKDDIAQEIRRLTGEPDPTKRMTPEEEQQAQAQAQAQAEAMQIQRAAAAAALEEQQAKAREVNARAEKTLAEIDQLRSGAGQDGGAAEVAMQLKIEDAVRQVREQAATQIDRLSQQLAKLTASNEAAMFKSRSDADATAMAERIKADAAVRVAEIQAASDKKIDALLRRIEDLAKMSGEIQSQVKQVEAQAKADLEDDKAERKAEQEAAAAEKSEPEPAPAPPPPPPPPPPAPPPAPITINVQVDAAKGEVKKTVTVKRDAEGNLVGEVTPEGGGS